MFKNILRRKGVLLKVSIFAVWFANIGFANCAKLCNEIKRDTEYAEE